MNKFSARFRPFAFLISVVIWSLGLQPHLPVGMAQNSTSIGGVVSAASFLPVLAPEGLAALFGLDLAATTQVAVSTPLPTTLAGRQLLVNDEPAPLLFVAPGQINFLMPATTRPGTATLKLVNASKQVLATRAVEVQATAPGIFIIAGNIPAASVLRVAGNGVQTGEPIAQETADGLQLRPVRFGAANDSLYLILFLTGLRGARREDVKIVFGSEALTPAYASAQGDLVGLDQINVELPRRLQGRIRFFVSVADGQASNSAELEIEPFAPLSVEPLDNNQPVTVSQELKLRGSGLAEASTVMIGGATATILASSASELTVRVPFGARTGPVIVETAQGKAISSKPINVRPSVSGTVANVSTATDRGLAPLAGVKIQVTGGQSSPIETTGGNGSYLLTNLPDKCFKPSICLIRYDPTGLPQRFEPYTRLVSLERGQDFQINVVFHPVAGATSTQQQGSGFTEAARAQKNAAPAQSITRYSAGDVFLELPAGNQPIPSLTLLSANVSLGLNPAPVPLPAGVYSSRIVQLAPMDLSFEPGGRLVFPNTEKIPAGTPIKVYHYVSDEARPSNAFVPLKDEATVRADGLIVTAAGAIKTGGYYFVAAEQPLARNKLFFGRVVDKDGRPLPQAEVQVRGQNNITDSSGAFAAARVPVSFETGKEIILTASYRQPNGRVLFATRSYNEGTLTAATFKADDIQLVELPRPPVIIAPDVVTVNANSTASFNAKIYDPDNPNDFGQLTLSLPLFPFITRSNSGADYSFQLRPGLTDVGDNNFTISVTHTGSGLVISKTILIKVLGAPARFKVLEPVRRCDSGLPSGPVVNLSWETAQNATSYKVYRDNVVIKEVSAPTTTYTDRCIVATNSFENCLIAGRSYQYRVEALSATAATAADAPVTVAIPGQLCDGTTISLALPTSATGKVNEIVTIPVLIGDLTGYSTGTLAYEFDLQFDATVLEFVESPDTSETISQDVLFESNANKPGEAGRLRLAAIARNGRLGGPNATLIKLKFRVLSARSSRLVFSRFMLNETVINTQEGRFTAN